MRGKMIGEHELETRMGRMADSIEAPDEAELGRMAGTAVRLGQLRGVARSRRQPLRIALVAALALGVAALLPAMFSGDVRGLFAKEASAQPPVGVWRWGDRIVPGRPIRADALVRGSVRRLGVAPARVHRVGPSTRPMLLAAIDRIGRVCFAARTATSFRGFTCVSLLSPEAVVHFSASRSTILGIVRTDVQRLVATRLDGREEQVTLDLWRAFHASARGGFTYLSAYTGDGGLVERVAIGNSLRSRLCGAPAEPCPPAL